MPTTNPTHPRILWPASQGLSIVWVSRHALHSSQIKLLKKMHGRKIEITEVDYCFREVGHFLEQLRQFQSNGQLPYVVIRRYWRKLAIDHNINLGWFGKDHNSETIYQARSIHCYINGTYYNI